ncbi:MAG: hypothetical protein LBQ66_00340 [Planctomycetaceae bacterium]|nr:hypothetical protein [Planctomycetaceae bacterium]
MIYWRRYSPRKPGSRLPTLRLPNRLGVQFKLVRFYYAQRRAGCPRSSPRRFAAIVGYADGNGLVLPTRFGDPAVGEYADVTAQRSVAHLTLATRFADAFWRSRCRLRRREFGIRFY